MSRWVTKPMTRASAVTGSRAWLASSSRPRHPRPGRRRRRRGSPARPGRPGRTSWTWRGSSPWATTLATMSRLETVPARRPSARQKRDRLLVVAGQVAGGVGHRVGGVQDVEDGAHDVADGLHGRPPGAPMATRRSPPTLAPAGRGNGPCAGRPDGLRSAPCPARRTYVRRRWSAVTRSSRSAAPWPCCARAPPPSTARRPSGWSASSRTSSASCAACARGYRPCWPPKPG